MEEWPKIVLFVNYTSQPSRAVVAFCRLNNLPHEVKVMALEHGSHRNEEFKRIN